MLGFDTANICSLKLNIWLLNEKLARTNIFNLPVKQVILICDSVKKSNQSQILNTSIYRSTDIPTCNIMPDTLKVITWTL